MIHITIVCNYWNGLHFFMYESSATIALAYLIKHYGKIDRKENIES